MDFSEPSLAAARWTATRLAPGAEIVLVHAVFVPEPPRFLRGLYPPPDELRQNAERGAHTRMREFGPSIGAKRIWTEIRIGRPAECVSQVAEELSADLIVAGAHGERTGIWKMLGGTAHHLLQQSTRPVLVARGLPSSPPRRILMPLDDSPASARALAWASMLARQHEAELVVLHVVNPSLLGATEIAASEPERRRAADALETSAREWASTQVQERAADVERTRIEIAQGDPGFEILAAAKGLDADLIVLGRRGSGATRMVLGSVADFVLRSGTTSVLVLSDNA